MKPLFTNGFVMAPLKLGYCHEKDGKINERHLGFYSNRARHLDGVIPEPFYLDPGLRENPFQLGIDHDDKLPGLTTLVELLHHKGTKAIAHLNHPGRMANALIPGNHFWSSVTAPCENGGATPLSMDRKMMDSVIALFTDVARRASTAGFDAIELQFGHGYLLAQFLSPAINTRSDSYGGSWENRKRFPLEVLDAVTRSTPLPVMARISADDLLPGGIKLPEAIALARELENRGVVALHVTAGSACTSPPWYYQHMFIPKGKTWEMAAHIRESVQVPVLFHGRIHSREDIQTLREHYGATYFSIGRALVADEHFMEKVLGMTDEPVRPCLACSEGCLGGVKAGKGLGCVVNPQVNHDFPEQERAKSEGEQTGEPIRPKQIAVVGGGIAGMEAAVSLTQQGHQVTLFEKEKLGGQFLLAALPPHKESLQELIDYYLKEVKRFNISVRYVEATPDLLTEEGFEEIIMATGSQPVIPPVPGLTDIHWAEVLLEGEIPEGKDVVVIGGGLIGVEIASALVDHGNRVTIVEMLEEVARGLEMIERTLTMKKLAEKEVRILLKYRVTEVTENSVIARDDEQNQVVISPIDLVVVATGMKSYLPFTSPLPTRVIGDARQVAKAQEAILDGYTVGTNF